MVEIMRVLGELIISGGACEYMNVKGNSDYPPNHMLEYEMAWLSFREKYCCNITFFMLLSNVAIVKVSL